MNNYIESYINSHSKSQIIGFLLTLILGPLGLFYSSWVSAVILCAIAITSATSITIYVVCWGLSILLSFIAVSNYNKRVRDTANLTL